MGGKSSAPPPPDPNAVSQAQTQSNVNTALDNATLNRYTTNTPLGSQSWSINGYTTDKQGNKIPNYVQTTTLTPNAQKALDATQANQLGQAQTEGGFLQNVRGQLENPLSQNDFGTIQKSLDGVDLMNPQGTGAMDTAFNANYQLVAPLMQQQSQKQDDQLRAEGIPEGSDLWNTAHENLAREQSNQIAGIASGAVGQGLAEQGQLFGQQQNKGAFANSAQATQAEQALALRNQPLNELSALQSGSQVATPQFQATPGVSMAGTNTAGNVYSSYQGAVNSANANNALSNNLFGDLTGVGGSLGAAAIMSDRRSKKDIEEADDLPMYRFRYKGEPDDAPKHLGVMAQDAEKVDPSAVITGRDGMKRVMYAKLLMGA